MLERSDSLSLMANRTAPTAPVTLIIRRHVVAKRVSESFPILRHNGILSRVAFTRTPRWEARRDDALR